MSTKTTFKRIALVTVAALGFGVMSVAPSNAAINADTLTLSSATASQTTAETATATSAVATISFLGSRDDSISVTASLVSAPAGNTALPVLSLIETASAVIDGVSGGTDRAVGYTVAANEGAVVNAETGTAVTTAKFRVFIAGEATTGATGAAGATAPSVAGTYVVKLTPAAKGANTLAAATAQTLTITVTKAAADDTVATSATSIITVGETVASTTNGAAPTIDDVNITASSAAPASSAAAAVATIKVSLKNAALLSAVESYTATITGPGTLGSAANSGTTIDGPNPTGRSLIVQNNHIVQVWSDGTSGVATITITSKAGLVLATEKVTFFGDIASIVTTAEATVLNATTNNGDGSDITTRPIKVVVKDAAGVSVSDAALKVTSETLTIVSDSYAACGTADYDATEQAYFCQLTGVAAGKTKITVGTKTSATDTTAGRLNGNAVEVRVGTQVAASVKVTLDKATYLPGEKATLTVALFDKDGLVVADGTYADIFKTGGITTNYQLGAGSDTTTATVVANKSTGLDAIAGSVAYTVYMPVVSAEVIFSWTTGGTAVTGSAPTAELGLLVANQGVKGSVTATVSNPGTDAAAAAAEEATAAANDATDAALSAAEAAEAATAMAQEAVDAVAELSASVTKLISALRAQITTLTNLVVKIQKKVKA
jgi:hypothetical protein